MANPNMTTDQPQLLPHVKLRKWHYGVLLFLLLMAVGVLAFVIFQPIQVLPRIRLAPGFSLIDQNGERLTSEDVRGRFTLYYFTYARCDSEACQRNNQILRQVQDRLSEVDTAGLPVTLVTISFDPDHDTPETLHAFASDLGADPAHWRMATTDAASLKNIIGRGFEVYYEPKADGSFAFSPTMILVDGWGIVRAVYNTRTQLPEPDRILRHLSVLAEEVRNSKGIARLGYEAAHLFLCYAS